jgi:gas vesicle protein
MSQYGEYGRGPEGYDDSRGISLMIAGFGLGALVGTVIGLLIAPKSGRELRGDIADYSRDAYGKVKDMSREGYERSREAARHAYESGRERAGEYGAMVTERIQDVKEGVAEAAGRLRKAVNTGIEEARDTLKNGDDGQQTA